MKVTKVFLSRLEVELPCSCKASKEYKDHNFKEPQDAHKMQFCEKHLESSGNDIIEMVLVDRLNDVAKEANELPAPPPNIAPAKLPNPKINLPNTVKVGTNLIRDTQGAGRPLPTRTGIKRTQ